jgi:hypothetical protein
MTRASNATATRGGAANAGRWSIARRHSCASWWVGSWWSGSGGCPLPGREGRGALIVGGSGWAGIKQKEISTRQWAGPGGVHRCSPISECITTIHSSEYPPATPPHKHQITTTPPDPSIRPRTLTTPMGNTLTHGPPRHLCPSPTPQCSKSLRYCTTCTNSTTCASCWAGHTLVRGACVPCPRGCIDCQGNPAACRRCSPFHVREPGTQRCIPL